MTIRRATWCFGLLIGVFHTVGASQTLGPADYLRQALEARQRGHPEAAISDLKTLLSFFDSGDPAHALNLAIVYNELSVVQRMAGRNQAAWTSADRAVRIAEATIVAPVRLVTYLINRGNSALDLRRFNEAERDFASAAQLDTNGGDDASALRQQALLSLGQTNLLLGKPTDAITALQKGISLARQAGENALVDQLTEKLIEAHLALRDVRSARAALTILYDVSSSTRILLEARILVQEGAFEAAEALLSAVAADAKQQEIDAKASAIYNLAEIEFMRGRYSEASILNDRAENLYLRQFGPRHHLVGQTTHRRALIDRQIGNFESAKAEYRAALSILTENFSGDHPLVLSTTLEASRLYSDLGDHDLAVATARTVLEKIDATSSGIQYERLLAHAALGLSLFAAGDFSGAAKNLETVRRMREEVIFPAIDEPPGLNALAEIYLAEGRAAEAFSNVSRSIEIQKTSGLVGVDTLGESTRILASVERRSGNAQEAIRLARENSARIGARLRELARVPSFTSEFAPLATRRQVAQHLELLWESTAVPRNTTIASEMFEVAQYVHLNETTKATNGFVRNSLEVDDPAGMLLRERQRLWYDFRALTNAASQEKVLADRLMLQNQIAALDQILADEHPNLASLLSPSPSSVADVQALLEDGQGFWLQASFEAATFVFLLTRDRILVARTELGESRLQELVSSVRRSVDVRDFPSMPDFAFMESAELYRGLFEPFAPTLPKVEHLILVPDLAAQQLSLAALVAHDLNAPPETSPGYPGYRFLGLTHALSVVPSPQALLRWRLQSVSARASDGFVGFGAPLLSGSGSGPDDARRAIDRASGLAQPNILSDLFEPLPETADELRKLASGSSASRLFLGENAREATFKGYNLNNVRTLVFATHAIVAGDFDHLSEPALVLTPPEQSSEEDDGLLTTSEIAAKSIGADLVILSACNTGSVSGRSGAAGLSGLASGFFEAGAKSLVVTHWTILSASSLIIIPQFYGELSGEMQSSPSVALRNAMRKTANNDKISLLRHPAFWAPFAIVGPA